MPITPLTKNETDWLDTAFPHELAAETKKPHPGDLDAVRVQCVVLGKTILEHCPPSADRTVALRCVRDALNNAREALTKDFSKVKI